MGEGGDLRMTARGGRCWIDLLVTPLVLGATSEAEGQHGGSRIFKAACARPAEPRLTMPSGRDV